jgi:glucose/arabinose dehydrogenase
MDKGRIAAAVVLALGLAGCAGSVQRSTQDYGQTPVTEPAPPNLASGAPEGSQLAQARPSISVPAGFRAIPEAVDIRQPRGLAADDLGGVLVIEEGRRLIRLGPDGGRDVIAEADANSHWTGVAVHAGVSFITAVGGTEGGQLLRIDSDGRTSVLMQRLPNGLHPVEAPAVGPDGMVYVGVGTVTNAGIVEKDNPSLAANPAIHDVPCQDVRLRGRNVLEDGRRTGAFVPWGTATRAGDVIAGQIPCSGAVLRTTAEGGTSPQLVAWGFRDPRGLAFTPEGRLYLLDDNFQAESVRPVAVGGDLVFAVAPGVWYGWPDAHGSQQGVQPLLAAQPNPPPRPVAEFPTTVRATSLDIARDALFGGSAQAYVSLAVPQFGARIVRLDLRTGALTDFAELPQASEPVGLRFSPTGDALYVLESGGTLWRIERDIPVG